MTRRKRQAALVLAAELLILTVFLALRYDAGRTLPETPTAPVESELGEHPGGAATNEKETAETTYAAPSDGAAEATQSCPDAGAQPENAASGENETGRAGADADAVYLAQCLWGEARGVQSQTEQAAVAWCVLNRVAHPGFPDTVYAVLSAPNQFIGFSTGHPVDPALLALAQDVLDRWMRERSGETNAGRVLPENYLWFSADGHGHNAFRSEFRGGTVWGWTLESPYDT